MFFVFVLADRVVLNWLNYTANDFSFSSDSPRRALDYALQMAKQNGIQICIVGKAVNKLLDK